jgi:sterol desaturase/sphingolipid hydroxylase (fatty acid hydroxylase superfamily)
MKLFEWQSFLLLLMIFVPLERLLAMHPEQKLFRAGWRNDLIYVFVNGLLIKAGTLALIVAAMLVSEALIPGAWRRAVAAQPYWLQTVEVLIIADLGFYLIHRSFHAVPWLWKFHAVHHSIEELDWLAAHRVHPVDQILTKGVSLIPCFALGFSEVAIGIYALVYHWHSILLHANVRIGFGPFRWLFASPEFHHWHHSDHREAYNRNFAGQLAILDFVFGTAHLTRGRAPTKYGCSDPVPGTYLPQLLYPFRRLLRRKPIRPASLPAASGEPSIESAVPASAGRVA